MKRELADSATAAPELGRPSRCVCCDGVIEMPPDQDVALGLNLALGLVSDECVLICNGCTSRLIAAGEAEKAVVRGRR
jgi:hypothetical protein